MDRLDQIEKLFDRRNALKRTIGDIESHLKIKRGHSCITLYSEYSDYPRLIQITDEEFIRFSSMVLVDRQIQLRQSEIAFEQLTEMAT